MASFPAPSYHMQQMSEGTLAASYLGGGLLLVCGGTQDEPGLPNGQRYKLFSLKFCVSLGSDGST